MTVSRIKSAITAVAALFFEIINANKLMALIVFLIVFFQLLECLDILSIAPKWSRHQETFPTVLGGFYILLFPLLNMGFSKMYEYFKFETDNLDNVTTSDTKYLLRNGDLSAHILASIFGVSSGSFFSNQGDGDESYTFTTLNILFSSKPFSLFLKTIRIDILLWITCIGVMLIPQATVILWVSAFLLVINLFKKATAIVEILGFMPTLYKNNRAILEFAADTYGHIPTTQNNLNILESFLELRSWHLKALGITSIYCQQATTHQKLNDILSIHYYYKKLAIEKMLTYLIKKDRSFDAELLAKTFLTKEEQFLSVNMLNKTCKQVFNKIHNQDESGHEYSNYGRLLANESIFNIYDSFWRENSTESSGCLLNYKPDIGVSIGMDYFWDNIKFFDDLNSISSYIETSIGPALLLEKLCFIGVLKPMQIVDQLDNIIAKIDSELGSCAKSVRNSIEIHRNIVDFWLKYFKEISKKSSY